MKKQPVRKPTDAELAILRVLWERGPLTVREVHESVLAEQKVGYTTVLKILQIMTDKGLVVRDERERAHVYAARESQQATQGQLLRHLIDRAFGGSPAKLVMRALSTGKADANELSEIRRLIDEMERAGG